MKFNHKKFFDAFKPWYLKTTGKELDSTKVQAVDFIVSQIELYDDYWTMPEEVGYLLGTIHIETYLPKTDSRYQPIREGGSRAYFIKRYWTNVDVRTSLGNKTQYDAYARSGRSYVQVTGLSNDTKLNTNLPKVFPNIIAEFENRTGQKFDLIKNPEQLLDPYISFAALSYGMKTGLFTGKKLSTYINSKKLDFKNARRVINGLDRAQEIANYAIELSKIFKDSLVIVKSIKEPEIKEPIEPEVKPEEVPEKDEASKSEQPPKQDDPVPVLQQTASLKTRIITGGTTAIAFLGSIGFSVGTFLQSKLENITLNQILIIGLFLAVGCLGVYFWDRASQRAHEKTKQLIALAGDENKNTVAVENK